MIPLGDVAPVRGMVGGSGRGVVDVPDHTVDDRMDRGVPVRSIDDHVAVDHLTSVIRIGIVLAVPGQGALLRGLQRPEPVLLHDQQQSPGF